MPSASGESVPSTTRPPVSSPNAILFSRRLLPKVSRTFALNIPMLPPQLAEAVTVAYLLCRVADCIEDETTEADHPALFAALADVVQLADGWEAQANQLSGRLVAVLRPQAPPGEVELVRGLAVVLSALGAMPPAVRAHVATCVRTMSKGMAGMLARRRAAAVSLSVLPDVTETLEYCYYVAGTVGELLTDLFAWSSPQVAKVHQQLTTRAVAFGRALQLTNILKDVRADLDAGRCFLPEDVLRRHGFAHPGQLAEPSRRTAAVAVLTELVAVARREFDVGVEYIACIPREEVEIRRFCLVPLILAALTLRKLNGNPAVFEPCAVKISRRTVRIGVATALLGARWPFVVRLLGAILTLGLPSSASPDHSPESG